MWVLSLGWKDPLEQETATHFSVLAWRIPWTDGPGGLQPMGSHKSQPGLSLQATEQHLPQTHHRFRSPSVSPGGAVHQPRTGKASTHPRGPLTWPCTRAQWPELDETGGASSQGTDSEPRPPGLLLGVTLHTGPSAQNWRVKGSGGHQSPPSSQKQGRGGAPGAHPVHPFSSPQPAPAPPHLFAKSLPSSSPHS